jgi:hypothetical protein
LGSLREYAEKWNRADLSAATHGLGKDKLPVVDNSGPRSTGQHLSRIKRAVKEFDTAWHDASANVVVSSTLKLQTLFLLHQCRFSISQLIDISSQSPSFGLSTQYLARNFLETKNRHSQSPSFGLSTQFLARNFFRNRTPA